MRNPSVAPATPPLKKEGEEKALLLTPYSLLLTFVSHG